LKEHGFTACGKSELSELFMSALGFSSCDFVILVLFRIFEAPIFLFSETLFPADYCAGISFRMRSRL